MFKTIEPFSCGYLPVSDENEIYWETSGNPKGKPALYLHGGPGGGISGGYRRHFDPEKFLIVGFEQRGCGRSRPNVMEDLSRLSANTTQKLIDDIEKLRQLFNVESWLIYGCSWGVTLAIAYAQAFPNRVSGLVLMAVNTTTTSEVEWITEGVRQTFPNEWEKFKEASHALPGERLVDAYYRRMTSSNSEDRDQAARAWCEWEDVHVSLDPKWQSHPLFKDPKFYRPFATLVTHYWKYSGFLKDQLLGNMKAISHIPGVLIHGRLDVSSPLKTAIELHQNWSGSELIVIDQEGHGGEIMSNEVTKAVERLYFPNPN